MQSHTNTTTNLTFAASKVAAYKVGNKIPRNALNAIALACQMQIFVGCNAMKSCSRKKGKIKKSQTNAMPKKKKHLKRTKHIWPNHLTFK